MMGNFHHNSPINEIINIANIDPILASSNNVLFFLSKYIDHSDDSHRIIIQIEKENLTHKKIDNLANELKPNEELSFLSMIKVNSTFYHLPMVDFATKKRSAISVEVAYEMANFWNMRFDIYDSGRSIHAYGTRLLNEQRWLKFMGYLLLLNEKSGEKVVDVRWIGHRLMSGFASLRITNNTGKYKTTPKYIGSAS